MALRADIKTECDAELDAEALRPNITRGWWMNVRNIYGPQGKRVIAYRVVLGNRKGFRFAFTQRDEDLPADIETVVADFGDEVIKEIRRRRRALQG